MITVAHVFFFCYVAMLLVIGASGVFMAPAELTQVFHVDLDRLAVADRSTFVNQYRFLKSTEFGAGVFCLVWRTDVFREPRFTHVFLVIVFAGVCARAFSVARDGRPKTLFLAFMALELLTGIAVAAVTHPF